MTKKKVAKEALTYLLGVCVPSPKQNASKIRVSRLTLDQHLLMYFKKHDFIYATDPKERCKTGDIVLIRNLPQKLTRVITHEVIDVVYPLGDLTDPISGKKIVAGRYREDVEQDSKLFGQLKSKFDYSKAQPRGKTRGKRDFSDKEIYVKYNELPGEEPDPYSVSPS